MLRITLVETIPKQLPEKPRENFRHFSNLLLSNWTKNFMAQTTTWWNGTDNRTHKKLMDFKSKDLVSGKPLVLNEKLLNILGDRDVKCTMMFMLNHEPSQFKLEVRLARLLGVHTATRSTIIHSLWQYIKKNKLQVLI